MLDADDGAVLDALGPRDFSVADQSAAPAPQHWTGANGVALAGETWGDPSAPHVFLLHGGGQTRHAWKSTGAKLAEAGYFAIAYDARGHGDSQWAPNADYRSDVMVEDLLAVTAELGSRQATLVGASMGGIVSLIATGEHRIVPSSLVLVDVAPRTELSGINKIRSFMTKPDGFASLDEVADAIASFQSHRQRPRSTSGIRKNVRLGTDGRFHWHYDPRVLDSFNDDREVRRLRLEACATATQVRTLLVRGGRSKVISEQGVQEFLALCQSATAVTVQSADHMVAGDSNGQFTEVIVDFLATGR